MEKTKVDSVRQPGQQPVRADRTGSSENLARNVLDRIENQGVDTEYLRRGVRSIRRLLRSARRQAYLDLFPDYRRSILLTGTGRSGTTWVSHIINFRNDFRYMFEPFHPKFVPACKPFLQPQYLRTEDASLEFLQAARRILSGQVRGAWVDKYNACMFPTRRLIKDIRTNLLLKWMHIHFPEVPIVLLLRHPCAVANSRIKKKFTSDLGVYLGQPDLVNDFLSPFVPLLEDATEPFEQHVLRWCIESFIPLKLFSPTEICVLFYETLCTQPEVEIGRLFSYLKLPFDQRLRQRVLQTFQAPSPEVRKESAIFTGSSLVAAWQREVDEKNVCRTVEILNIFGLNELYTENPMPVNDFVRRWTKGSSGKSDLSEE